MFSGRQRGAGGTRYPGWVIIDCNGCGAPLDVASGASVVVCGYCKAQNQVATSRPSVHVHVHVQGPTPPPPPVMTYGPTPVPTHVPIPARRSGVGLSLVLALVGMGVAVGIPLAIQSGALGELGGLLGVDSFGYWSSIDTCLVDANGDGVDDVAGLSGPAGLSYTPTLVDGSTGKVLWKGQDAGEGAEVACLDRKWLVVGKADFELQLHDVKKPEAPVSLRGRDKLQEAAMGKGCAALKLSDGSVMGVALPAGTPTECAAKFVGPWETPGLIGLTGESTELTVGERRYTLAKRSSGTPVLTLKIEERGKTVLDKELGYSAATFSSGMAVAGERVVIFGARPGKQDEGMLVGIDAKTGAELYAVPLQAQVTHNIGMIAYNGRYVVMQYWTHLRAYEPATGEQVW